MKCPFYWQKHQNRLENRTGTLRSASILFSSRSYHLIETRKTCRFHLFNYSLYNRGGDSWTFINQASVKLDQRCPRGKFFPGIGGMKYASHSNDREFARSCPINVPNHFGTARAQWTAAQASGFGVNSL